MAGLIAKRLKEAYKSELRIEQLFCRTHIEESGRFSSFSEHIAVYLLIWV